MSSKVLPDKIYYSISELSEHFGVAQSLLRYWEKEFDKINPKRNKKGTRFYSKQDVEQIKLVYHLVKEQGHTLEGARQKLKRSKKKVEVRVEVKDRLEKIKADLTALRDQL
jgi:DNA-binding transcriptional MerR regulator